MKMLQRFDYAGSPCQVKIKKQKLNDSKIFQYVFKLEFKY